MQLSTHVLDTARGTPAAQLRVGLYRCDGDRHSHLVTAATDDDGRIPAPFGGDLQAGEYELVFRAGEYFAQTRTRAFYDRIAVRFKVEDGERHSYHVPLLLSPWGYSTYRGS